MGEIFKGRWSFSNHFRRHLHFAWLNPLLIFFVYLGRKMMKSLASINDNDIQTIKMALNDSISDMNTELKGEMSEKKRGAISEYKLKYTRVFEKLKQNSSLYALAPSDLDIVAGGLNDAIELLEDHLLGEELEDDEKEEILTYKNDCSRLIDILAS
jgi:hypothetical protein